MSDAAAEAAPPTAEEALATLRTLGDAGRAAGMATYHKTPLEVLGVSNPEVDALAQDWRARCPDLAARVALASGLWETGVFEARLAAARLLTQARIRDDAPAWRLIAAWVPEFDGWAVADHVAKAGERRLAADPSRLDEVEGWTDPAAPLWTRRAALVFTLPWAKMNHPSAEDLARRERILGWAAAYAPEREWFLQKAVSWWLRTLSKRDPERVRAFLDAHGGAMKGFARRDAARLLP